MIAGRYTLIREIGRGGSGTVHLARDEALGRLVAIKRIGLLPGATNPDLARAEREARLSAALNHPNVVSVFDLAQDDDIHWLVMEYVEGQTLAELVAAQGPLESTDAAMVLGQAADALASAHEAGIVHRDVKPSNILLSHDLTAKLSDFGIARSADDLSLTQTGLVTGSPAYLAPEVASGASATPASDVWSLGATLFQAVTGTPPYDTTKDLMGALHTIVNEEPPRLDPEHPLAAIVEVTMQKDPARRWQMRQVRDALRGVVRGEATVVAATPTTRDSHPPMAKAPTHTAAKRTGTSHRGRPLGWLAAGTLLGLMVALTVWLWPGDGAKPDPEAIIPATSAPPTSGEDQPSELPTDAAEARLEMTDFIEDYLKTVTTDPRQAWTQLTPDFQQVSGGFTPYARWWRQVRTATPSKIVANAANQTIGYTVDYRMQNGNRRTEQVILQLERRDDTYLIAGEA